MASNKQKFNYEVLDRPTGNIYETTAVSDKQAINNVRHVHFNDNPNKKEDLCINAIYVTGSLPWQCIYEL